MIIELLKAVGIPQRKGLEAPVVETYKGITFVKFMSDRGLLDEMQGDRFAEFLVKHRIDFTRKDERKFLVDTAGFRKHLTERISNLWLDEEDA